jgi:PAS domain S-box-containing protein
MRRHLSLRWKLIIGSVIVEVVMLTVLVFNSVRLIETSLAEQVDLRLKEVSVLLNAALGPNLAAQDYGPILDVFAASRREQGIVYFALWDTGRFDTRMPITVGNQTYGQLQFGISTRFLVEARRNLTHQSLAIAGVEVVLSIALLILIGIWLTRHLKTLEEASRAVSAGNYDLRLKVNSKDEIGSLSRAFNTMATEISTRMDALRVSEERFRHLSELASDWYWEQDAEFRFTAFAGASFRDYPQLATTLVGQRRWDSKLIHISPQEMAAHRAVCEAHQAFRDLEYKTISDSGKVSWLTISGTPIFDSDGNFSGYRGSGRDITERKLAEFAMLESEQKFASLFQLSPLPMALTDLETGLISDVNESWTKLFGYSHSEAVARSLELLHLFTHEQQRLAFEDLIVRYGSCESIEAQLSAHDGSTLSGELAGRTLEIGERRFFLWCVRDITQQRRAEAQIRDLNARLEIRVAERTRELENTLETLNRAQDNLINSEKLAALGRVVAAVAHELNTPIGNSVMVATTLEEKAREFAALVESGSIRRSQINDYVQGSCAGTEMLVRNLQQAHMAPTLRKTPYQLELDIEDGLLMNSYPGPLGQVITNFVNNALLHAFDGMSGGKMTLVARGKPDTGFIQLSFSDDGRGMDAEHLKHIFDPFFTTRLGQGGSGLGLNIVYNLVTRILGGSIEVTSTPWKGTSFLLYLPKVAPERETQE